MVTERIFGSTRASVGEDAVVLGIRRHARLEPDRPAIAVRRGTEFVEQTAADLWGQIEGTAKGLMARGVEAGDRVGVLGQNSAEWLIADLAIAACGAAPVPIYATSSAEQVDWILSDSEARVLFLADDADPSLRATADRLGATTLELSPEGVADLIDRGGAVPQAEFERRLGTITGSRPAAIVYTSGTTGRPKGCVLTHGNLQVNVDQTVRALGDDVGPGDSTLLFLPMTHVLGRMVALFCLHRGVLVAFATSQEALPEELLLARPTLIAGVPRVFEKVYSKAHHRATVAGRGFVMDRAMAVATRWSQERVSGRVRWWTEIEHRVFDRLVYGRVRDVFGGRLRFAFSGGAPLGERLTFFYDGCGIPIYEGYGLTETSPIVTISGASSWRPGSVGKAVGGTSIRIEDDGEIRVKGPQVFHGYWNQPTATADVLDDDGWFSTGDLGELDDDGYLRIVGRKKEIIVTAGGKNVAPAPLEDRLRAHPVVSQAVVVGEGRKFVAALVTLDPDGVDDWLNEHEIECDDMATLVDDSRLLATIQEAVDEANRSVSKAESIRKFCVLPEEFSLDRDEITPTLKVKRSVVADHYRNQIDEMFEASRPLP